MDLDTDLLVQGELHAHDRGKQGEHDGRRGASGWAFVTGYLLVMRAEIEPDLPLDQCIHQ